MSESKTVFGNVCSRSAHPENDSTEALRYILTKSKAAALEFERFVNACGSDIPAISWFESQYVSEDSGIPDLTCLDERGEPRVLVEDKFWAGLTENQPVEYLRLLPKTLEALLLFVVPEARRDSIWQELALRCKCAGIELSDSTSTPTLATAKVSELHRLAVTGWHTLLNRLEEALISADDRSTASDVAQLRGLCDAMDSQAFLPLRADEITNINVPRRMIDYSNLVQEIADVAVQQGTCSRENLRPTHRWYGAGTYLWLGKLGMWFGVDAERWGRWGVSPIWCEFSPDENFGKARIVRERLRGWNVSLPQRAYDDGRSVVIPIVLQCGVEKHVVTKLAVEQLRQLRGLLEVNHSCTEETKLSDHAPLKNPDTPER
jgi:hypothetical protein